jgi:hypothetical protein
MMHDLLLELLPHWPLATGGLAAAGSIGVILSRLTWKSGLFWTVSRHVWKSKGLGGLLMSLGLPVLADVLKTPLYLKRAVGLKPARVKKLRTRVIQKGVISPEAIREPRTVTETYQRVLMNPRALHKMEAVHGKEGPFLVVTFKLTKEDAPWIV